MNAFVLGDVRCKYIPVRRTFSAGLVISTTDEIFVFTAMYVGSIGLSVTGPQACGNCEGRIHLL